MSSINEALRRSRQSGASGYNDPPADYSLQSTRNPGIGASFLWVSAIIVALAAAALWFFIPPAKNSVKKGEEATTIVSSPAPAADVLNIKKSVIIPKSKQENPLENKGVLGEDNVHDQKASIGSDSLVSEPEPAGPEAAWPRAAVFEEPGQVRPEDAEEYSNPEEYFRAAGQARENGLIKDAIRYYNKAVELDPEMIDAYLNLGNIYYFEGQDAEKALEMYRRVLELDGKNKLAHNNMGVILLNKGLFKDAEQRFEAAVELDPDYVDALYNMACVSARRGRKSLAVSYLLKAGRINPEVAVWALNDKDLESIHKLPEFKRFAGQGEAR